MALLKTILVTVLFIVNAIFATGCVPFITGLKSYTGSDGSRMEFITGADLSFGVNGIDKVDNNRGIAPGTGYKGKEKY